MKGNKIVATIVVLVMLFSTMVVLNKLDVNFIEKASASVPGVDTFGNASTDLVYDTDTWVPISINTTGLATSTIYYLQYPLYSYDGSTYNLSWSGKFDHPDAPGENFKITTDSDTTTNRWKSVTPTGYLTLNVSGLWAFTLDGITARGDNSSNFLSTIKKWFWVNTSSEWTIDQLSDFKYGANTSHTVNVAGANGCYVDIYDKDGNTTIHHGWNSTSALIFHDYNFISTMYAGNYTMRAYRDLDVSINPNGYGTATEGYSRYYGGNPSVSADYYSWGICGAWDPPEINGTETSFEVDTGVTIASIAAANYTQYWNFSGLINVTIDKDRSGVGMDTSDYHVEVRNRNNENVTNNVTITKNKGYCIINSTSWGKNGTDIYGTNGTWKIYIWSDLNGDRKLNGVNKQWTEEWNKTINFKVIKAPGAQFKWVDDDAGLSTDNNDGVLPFIPAIASAPVDVTFQIIGSDHSYYGATESGKTADQSKREAMENITVSGNALFTGTLDNIPGASYSGGTWTVPVTPMMSQDGGTITITAVWADYGSLEKELDVGGLDYATNGTVVTVTSSEFTIDEDQTLTITVTDANGNPYPWANIWLYWLGDVHDGTAQTPVGAGTKWLKRLIGGGTSAGTYTIGFNQSLQRDNQTGAGTHSAGFTDVRAPRNLTVYVEATNAGNGYALVQMKPKSDLKVTVEAVASSGTSTLLAGFEYSKLYFNTTVDSEGNTTVYPNDDDYAQLSLQIFDESGNEVTDDIGSFTQAEILGRLGDGDYVADLSTEYITTPGTYTVYVYNYTSDSKGNNATLVVKQAKVEVDKSPLIWSHDANISVTFTVTDEITGAALPGVLLIDNITWTDGTYNKTYTNSSFNGVSDLGPAASIELGESDGFINGTVTVNDVTANYLPFGVAYANITFWFQPEDADGNLGEWARAKGLLRVEVPTATPDTPYISVGRTTTVNIDVTGRGDKLADVYVRVHGRGVDQNGTSGADGRVTFSILPTTTGNISISVGEENRTTDNVIIVTSWILDISTDPVSQVDEGDTFTVTVIKEGTTTAVEGALVKFSGVTQITDATGETTFTAPTVTSDRTFTITATAIGYAPDPDALTITVVNVPKLILVIPDEVQATTTFEVAVADDTGSAIIGAIITFNEKTYTTGVNGIAKLTAPKTKGDYPITAIFGTYVAATGIVTVTAAPGIPGFELLSLIAALGVAFILFRRRRRR